MKNVISFNFSSSIDEERTAKFKRFAEEVVSLNLERITLTIDSMKGEETVQNILDTYIDSILAARYQHLSKEDILREIQTGRLIELRTITLNELKNDPVIQFHLDEEQGHPVMDELIGSIREQYQRYY